MQQQLKNQLNNKTQKQKIKGVQTVHPLFFAKFKNIIAVRAHNIQDLPNFQNN